jgi:hypothetical protein
LDGQKIQRTKTFKYLGLTIHKDRKIEEDVAYRIRAGLIKWRSACRRALCDCRIPVKLKEKIYRITIRPSMLYGMEC